MHEFERILKGLTGLMGLAGTGMMVGGMLQGAEAVEASWGL